MRQKEKKEAQIDRGVLAECEVLVRMRDKIMSEMNEGQAGSVF